MEIDITASRRLWDFCGGMPWSLIKLTFLYFLCFFSFFVERWKQQVGTLRPYNIDLKEVTKENSDFKTQNDRSAFCKRQLQRTKLTHTYGKLHFRTLYKPVLKLSDVYCSPLVAGHSLCWADCDIVAFQLNDKAGLFLGK